MPRVVTVTREAVVAYGHPNVDSIYINEIEFDGWSSFHIIKQLNQLWSFEIEVFDIRAADQTNVQQGKVVKIFVDNNLLFKGKIETIEYKSENECTIKGYNSGALDLLHRDVGTTRRDHTAGVATNTLVGYLLSTNYDGSSPWIINAGTNSVTETAYVRFEMTNRLKCLDALSKHTYSEWWVSHGGSANHTFPFNDDYFNFAATKGTGTSLHTFNLSGTSQNATICKRERDMENVINDCTVLGYGDGINQISATSNDTTGGHQAACVTSIASYGRKQRTYVDRTLVSTTAALSIADDIVNTQLDPIERITIELEDVYDFIDRQLMRMTVDIGDTVTIIDTDTNLNSTYKIQGIEYTNDMNYGPKMILECSQKKLSMLDELEDTRKNVENIDVYMQGSTVCWNLSEKENLDASNPLNMRFYLPSHIIRINRAELSFQISDFRGYTQTSMAVTDPTHTHDISIGAGGGHTHSVAATTTQTNTAGNENAHYHEIYWYNIGNDESNSGNILYFPDPLDNNHTAVGKAKGSAGSQSLTNSICTNYATTAHNHSIPSLTVNASTAASNTHTHTATAGASAASTSISVATSYGISVDTQTGKWINIDCIRPDASSVVVSSGTVTSWSTTANQIDIADFIAYATKGAGWYNIEFNANKNARVEANCYLQFFIESQ